MTPKSCRQQHLNKTSTSFATQWQHSFSQQILKTTPSLLNFHYQDYHERRSKGSDLYSADLGSIFLSLSLYVQCTLLFVSNSAWSFILPSIFHLCSSWANYITCGTYKYFYGITHIYCVYLSMDLMSRGS